MRPLPILLAAAPLLLAAAETPPPKGKAEAPMPPAVKAMLDAALASGNEGEVATISKYARTAAPDSADLIADTVSAWSKARVAKKEEALQQAGLFDLWKGNVQLGGYISTGNSHNLGVNGAVNLTREGLRWRQKINLLAEYQESLGVTNQRHFLAAYEPNYKLNDRAYVYGSASFESNRILGYHDRTSISSGLGYSAIKTSRVKLDLEFGPAFRSTDFTDGTDEKSIAARGTVSASFKITPGLTLKEDAAGYWERYNSTLSSTTSIAAKLIGPLSAQLSYNVQYESMPPVGSVSTDTTSRASLVYQF